MTTPRDNEQLNRILRLYQQGLSVPQLAARFEITTQGIRDVLMRNGVLRLRKRKPACGNASTS
jgi:hypothetical protein